MASAALAVALAPRASHALDRFEIQVYEPDMNRPGQLALELHSNYTLRGQTEPQYPGEIPPHHVGRFTLEPALGITEWLELGAYLQTMVTPEQGVKYGGWKARTKLVLPTRFTNPFFFGLNIEVGKVPRPVEQDGWANEFRPMIGFDNGWVLVDFNPIFGYALSGSQKFQPDFEPAGKVSVNTQKGFALGAEYYAGLGVFAQGLSPWGQQEHLLFGIFDLKDPKGEPESEEGGEWELNVGIGRALNQSTPTQWIVKSVVGRSF
jgi:hypothetical protein